MHLYSFLLGFLEETLRDPSSARAIAVSLPSDSAGVYAISLDRQILEECLASVSPVITRLQDVGRLSGEGNIMLLVSMPALPDDEPTSGSSTTR